MKPDHGETGHTYTVQLRFSGESLRPSEISARLRLPYSDAFDASQVASLKKVRRSYWAYDGRGEPGFRLEWASLADGLEFLLENLRSRKAEIAALSRNVDSMWWCGHFQASFDGGPTLTAKLLSELGSYGVPLKIDNYFSDDRSAD